MQIRFIGDEVVAPVTEATASILDVAIAQKIPHYRECGGSARCTTCRVRILDGLQHVSKRSAQETAIAAQRGWDDTTRLACQTRVSGDVSLERLIRAGGDVAELQVEAVPADTGQELPLAILVCDMRDFTPFVEQHLAYDVVHMLNRFFTKLGTPILLNNGLIYQYVGDEISALFGVGGDTAEQSCVGGSVVHVANQHILERNAVAPSDRIGATGFQ